MQKTPSRGSVLTLSVTDPVDGKDHDVPLRFLRENGRVYVLAPAHDPPLWLTVALRTPSLRWRIGADSFEGIATPLSEPQTIRARFEAEFGVDDVARWFGGEVVGIALEVSALASSSYATRVEAYFDRAAADYDASVQANPLDRILRSVSLEILHRSFRPGDRVLEIGCGTGLETLPLAAAGIDITATDVSARMLDRLETKAAEAGLSDRIHVRHLRAGDLQALEKDHAPGSFQGAFSTFGALNCEPAWRDLVPILGRLLAPGARLVLGVWNRVCLLELGLYGISGRPRRALARLQTPAPVGLTRFGIPVHAATVHEYVRAFRPSFDVEAVVGLPVVLPPYDLWRKVSNPGAVLPLLAAVDARVRSRFPFNRLGDHFVLVLRRR